MDVACFRLSRHARVAMTMAPNPCFVDLWTTHGMLRRPLGVACFGHLVWRALRQQGHPFRVSLQDSSRRLAYRQRMRHAVVAWRVVVSCSPPGSPFCIRPDSPRSYPSLPSVPSLSLPPLRRCLMLPASGLAYLPKPDPPYASYPLHQIGQPLGQGAAGDCARAAHGV